ncbi:p53 and DNA damage-regulated protein 1 isoform X2 [Paramisgurnus dabryanus]|uniref:p53 and DNA damage-regulated protein 1 isoform X2 n=1 Tax=Paramisgurnus dabryanus TaxID=90735 RepID=UPI0031F3E508
MHLYYYSILTKKASQLLTYLPQQRGKALKVRRNGNIAELVSTFSRTCYCKAHIHTAASMDESAQRVLEYLTEVEVAAEDILADRQQIVDLDLRRNRNREALNALRNHSTNENVKVCFGNMFIKFSQENSTSMILKDQEQLDKEINDLRKCLKAKVSLNSEDTAFLL